MPRPVALVEPPSDRAIESAFMIDKGVKTGALQQKEALPSSVILINGKPAVSALPGSTLQHHKFLVSVALQSGNLV